MGKEKLAIIVPCFNEEEVLEETNQKLQEILTIIQNKDIISKDSFLVYIEDGSTDDTWNEISKIASAFTNVTGLRLDRNGGQQYCLRKALEYSYDKADIFVTIDADLQDNPYSIVEMVEKYNAGNQIVYGVRNKRDSDTFFYKLCANMYYKLLSVLDVKAVDNHSEFRLMSKEVVKTVIDYNLSSLYIRGICAQLKVPRAFVYYARQPRKKGESKYNYKSLMDTAFDGITFQGARPLMQILYLGLFLLLVGVSVVIVNIYYQNSALYGVLFILTGIILCALAAVGQYVGRILVEVQNRPKPQITEKIESNTVKSKNVLK